MAKTILEMTSDERIGGLNFVRNLSPCHSLQGTAGEFYETLIAQQESKSKIMREFFKAPKIFKSVSNSQTVKMSKL